MNANKDLTIATIPVVVKITLEALLATAQMGIEKMQKAFVKVSKCLRYKINLFS